MKKLVFLLITVIIALSQTISDGLRLSYQGLGYSPRSIGMGNAFGSISDDYAAFYFNPAGLGFIKKQEFSFGLDLYNFQNDVTFFNNKTSTNDNDLNLSNISYIYPFPTYRGSFVIGFSYNTTKNFLEINQHSGKNPNSTYVSYLTRYLTDTTDIPYYLILRPKNAASPLINNLYQFIDNKRNGNLKSFSMAASLEIDKDLFFGLDFDLINGEYKQLNSFKEADLDKHYQGIALDPAYPVSKNFNEFLFDKEIKWKIEGYSVKLGLIYQLKNIARVGFTLTLPSAFDIEEKYSETANAVFNAQPLKYPYEYSDKVKYSFTTPYNLTVSFSTFKFNTLVAFDFKYVDYSKIQIDNVEGLSDDFVKRYNTRISNELKSVFDINFGIEHHLYDLGLRLRAGYFTQNSAYKNDNSSSNKKFITLGFGYSLTDYTSFDLGVVYGWWKDVGDNYGYNLSRSYQDIQYKAVKIGISTRF